jgi:hypothetical protein
MKTNSHWRCEVCIFLGVVPCRQVSGCKHFKKGSVLKTSETTHPINTVAHPGKN